MNILLTSVGRRSYLIEYFKEALNDEGLIFASNSEYTYALTQADFWVLTPPIYDSQYVNFLIDYCKKKDINVIISLFDIDLLMLSKHKSKFEKAGISVIVSSEEVINICNDKWLTYLYLKNNNIKTPLTFISLDEVKDNLNKDILKFPIIIKPRWGMGSIGIFKIDSIEELEILGKKLKKIIFDTYLKFESSENEDQCILYQEYIQGMEYGIDIFNDLRGKLAAVISKRKIAMRAGETDIAKIEDSTPFLNIANKISGTLNHIGNLDVDCIVDIENRIYVIELNCRFGGQYPFSHLGGVNFPKQLIKWLKGEKNDASLLTPIIGTMGCKDLNPVILKIN